MNQISNADLREADLPPADANDMQIGVFAANFNGYEHAGSVAAAGEIATRLREMFERGEPLPADLNLLRTALFWEFRIRRFSEPIGLPPGVEWEPHWVARLPFYQAVVAAIRLARQKAEG